MAPAIQKSKILLVDDNPGALDVLMQILSNEGFHIMVATDGPKAIEQTLHDPPDLILLDVMMPGLNGFDTCRRLKEHKSTFHIPVLFMTAASGPVEIIKGFEAGAVDYITKPFELPELIARVRTHLELKRVRDELSEKAAQLEKLNAKLERLTAVDGLTEIPNRRSFDEFFEKEWKRAQRSREHLSLILVDIDFFREYNEHYGYQASDECLRMVAQTIANSSCRAGDFPARYSKDRFAVILVKTDLLGAVTVADNIHNRIQDLQIPTQSSPIAEYVSISIGVASVLPTGQHTRDELMTATENALAGAKQKGKNRVEASPLWWAD